MKLRKAFWTVGAGLAAAAGIAPQAHAQSVTPNEAPRAWLAYAETATRTVTVWLEDPGEPATRVRAYLDATRAGPDQPSRPLILKIWVDRKGVIARVEHEPLQAPAGEGDVRSILVGRQLPPPPKHMIQPMRIAVEIPPVPADPGAQAADPVPSR